MHSPFVIDVTDMKPLIKNTNPVVVIDDDVFQISLVKECYKLSARKNELICFDNGEDFIDYCNQVEEGKALMPELVLLDINMPKLNGFDILNYLKKKDNFASMPIVVMFTASDSDQDKAKAKLFKADAYMPKPYSIQEYVKFFEHL